MRKVGMLLALAGVITMIACGGGSNSNNGGNTTITSVTDSCSPSTITYGQTSQCTAVVSGTGNFSSAVTWSASAGSISSTGLFTAPSAGNVSLLVTVTATSTQDPSKSGTTTITVNPVQTVSNVQPIMVDAGPAPGSFVAANEPFVTVTVCVPGTSTCQNIDHVLVDTGSTGLRLLSAAGGGEFNLSLPNEPDSNGNPLLECLTFLDGFVWGNVATADVTFTVANEKAANVQVQVIIPSSSSPAVPSSCSSQTTGPNEGNSLSALGANGIIGVGLFQQDCGLPCTSANQTIPDVYYDCPSSGCIPIYATLAQQVTNPVVKFATDNNGVLIQLPAVPNGGSQNPSGSLIFGIGTQSNNALGSANVYAVPDTGSNAGDLITAFAGNSYPKSFLDSGSNGIFFLDTKTTGIPLCAKPDDSWYCPSPSPDNLSATNQGQTLQGPVGTPITVNFTIEDANTLFSNNGGSNTAFSTLGGPNAGSFDWGLAFFFGKNVFTAIENQNTPGGLGPYFAY